MVQAGSLPKRKIFINYRRADNPDFVERIRDWFAWKYGRDSVFMDFDTIPPFTPFADFIREQVRECDVLVTIIGPEWLRLLRDRVEQQDEEDYVQLEIRLAIEEGKPIAPICIKKAPIPRARDLPADLRPMLDYNMAGLDSGKHFLDNIEMLMDSLEQELSRLDGLKLINQDIQQVPFDIMTTLQRYQEAAEQGNWQRALDWLNQIRASGFAPAWYPLDDYEAEAREGLRIQEAERSYNFIRMMAERAVRGREERARVWEALEAFWEKYPGYDPDDLTGNFRPPSQAYVSDFGTSHEELVIEKYPSTGIFDPAIFEQLDRVDLQAADDLFDTDQVQAVTEALPRDDASFSLEDAERLGLIDDLAN